MIPRTVAAFAGGFWRGGLAALVAALFVSVPLAVIIVACDPTPTPTPAPTQGPIVARLALPYAGQWQRADWRTPSLLAYPRPSEAVTVTVGAYP